MDDVKDVPLKIELKENIKINDPIDSTIKKKKVKNVPKKYRKKPLWRNPNISDILYFD